MAPHPDVVPAEHRHRGKEHGGVEELLADAGERVGDLLGKARDKERARHAGGDAARHPEAAPRHAPARRQDDADDERGFENLTEDDECGGEHGGYLAMIRPWAVAGLKSPKKS